MTFNNDMERAANLKSQHSQDKDADQSVIRGAVTISNDSEVVHNLHCTSANMKI